MPVMDTPYIHVLVVEDNMALMANISDFLENHKRYVLDFAYDGLTALHQLVTHTYDVIVLDVMLPGLSGFALCQKIRTDLHCTTPIILMTARDGIDDKAAGFGQGADDYLVKPFNLKELALRIDALARRGKPALTRLRAGEVVFEPGTLQIRLAGGAPLQLSGMAARITDALMRAWPNYLSHEQLSKALWGDKEVDTHTLRTHVYTLRKLLHTHLGAKLIQTLHGRGYRFCAPDAPPP